MGNVIYQYIMEHEHLAARKYGLSCMKHEIPLPGNVDISVLGNIDISVL